MILSAQLLDVWDRCPRRYAFELTHEPRNISPLGLLYAGIEGSLTAADPCQGARDAIMEITQRLDVNAGDLSPNSAVKHVECMAEVIALALRDRMGRAKRIDPVEIGPNQWESNLFECRTIPNRIILTSHLDDDSLRSFAHSWQTIGELAALERSIMLTTVIIGPQRGGRRHSPWSKGFTHPVQKNLRIGRRKAGQADGFTSGWKECWREQTQFSAETWLDRLKLDELLGDLIVSRKIIYRGDDARMVRARSDLLTLATRAESVGPDEPMRRSSCDPIGRDPCPFQNCCYSATPVTPDDLPHLYRVKETPRAGQSREKHQGHIYAHTPS